ncbi:hypothetical protein HX744_00885 [Pseudonocardia sp. ICBG1122]|nr:hypothetical protein [Pseudonocardia pini]
MDEMAWRVGVLRSGAENTEWTSSGVAPDWPAARAAAVAALDELARVEARRQEYRFEVGQVVGLAMPGVDEDGRVDSEELASVLPLSLDR